MDYKVTGLLKFGSFTIQCGDSLLLVLGIHLQSTNCTLSGLELNLNFVLIVASIRTRLAFTLFHHDYDP